ncbi:MULTISPECIES: hypothetical protein [Vibrio]|uniref:hypothetical protein n=1 Tax=Vibrio TaxID=662 RepID=UPI000C8580F5|nr:MULTISPECIES: hypothetical protein [Vibrio]CAK2368098.1 conserved hypothetical protein [Vibrio crassostreae]MBO7911651.1 hypothetical protein [Vibrio sp. G41H]MCF7491343.1 hypothetical protein [Vibrio sp. G-C-1]PMG60933.1 hypothetical protein BCU89_26015 [Vibrio splendidus]CAK2511447.1 conserved hypothetical protein [Vibrio crassostreae]
MMLSLTNPEIAGANDGFLNVEAKHDNQMSFIVHSYRKATFPLSNHVELLDLSINRHKLEQATPHNQRRRSSSLLAKEGIVQIKFLTANNTNVSGRLLSLYFAANSLYGYPLFLIKPKAATKLEITVSNIDASVTLHSRLLVKSEGE